MRTLALTMALGLASSSFAGAWSAFSTDTYGVTSDGTRVDLGAGTYGVVDLYIDNLTSSVDFRILNLYDMTITLDHGGFVHNDLAGDDPADSWDAIYSAATIGNNTNTPTGENPAIDSFVTFGFESDGDAFQAILDPSFDQAVDASTLPTDVGWYLPGGSTQGDLASGESIFVGRFVIANADLADNELTINGTYAYNYQSPGVYTNSDGVTIDLGATVPVVPGPLAVAGFAAIGLVRGRRR